MVLAAVALLLPLAPSAFAEPRPLVDLGGPARVYGLGIGGRIVRDLAVADRVLLRPQPAIRNVLDILRAAGFADARITRSLGAWKPPWWTCPTAQTSAPPLRSSARRRACCRSHRTASSTPPSSPPTPSMPPSGTCPRSTAPRPGRGHRQRQRRRRRRGLRH